MQITRAVHSNIESAQVAAAKMGKIEIFDKIVVKKLFFGARLASPHIGLVLTGGGARAAYQVGALKALSEITQELGLERPFSVYSGISAGAINAVHLAGHAHNFRQGVLSLEDLWKSINTSSIFRTDPISLTWIGLRILSEFSLGAVFAKKKFTSLLDTSPLREFLGKNLQFERIQEQIDQGHLHGLAVTALDYTLGISKIFYQAQADVKPWKRIRRVGIPEKITLNHVLASSAIPFLFPPVAVGDHMYGDGSLRNYMPLSPPIKLGAKKMLVVGVRKRDTEADMNEEYQVSMARILTVILNSLLLDSVETDFERLGRINQTVSNLSETAETQLTQVDTHVIFPSANLGNVAKEFVSELPITLKHLIKGMGSKNESSDLISYLLFEKPFITRLIELGYKDVQNQRSDLIQFFK